MGEGNYRKLNMDLVASKPSKESSTADALADIVPIDWSPDVLSGKKKAVVRASLLSPQ